MEHYDYYLEVWLRDLPKDMLKGIIIRNSESFHPHVTLIRPFKIKNKDVVYEDDLKDAIVGFCKGKRPIPFALEGRGRFENKQRVYYFPVADEAELLGFNNGLEKELDKYVIFAEKLDEKKVLHMTIDTDLDMPDCPKTRFYMDRLTAMRNTYSKKGDIIWFSYDFINGRVLDRNQSRNKDLWKKTLDDFYATQGIIPSIPSQ